MPSINFVEFEVKHDQKFCVRHSADNAVNTVPDMPFLCKYFDSMLILCNIFVELEHFILFNNLDKYHNFIYYRINIK